MSKRKNKISVPITRQGKDISRVMCVQMLWRSFLYQIFHVYLSSYNQKELKALYEQEEGLLEKVFCMLVDVMREKKDDI